MHGNTTTNAKHGRPVDTVNLTKGKREWRLSAIELNYAYGQSEPDKGISKICVFALIGEKLNVFYRFKKVSYTNQLSGNFPKNGL